VQMFGCYRIFEKDEIAKRCFIVRCQPQTAEIYISRNGANTKKQLDAIHS